MEKAKKAYLIFVFLNVLWTFLILIAALALLVLLTIFLHWWKISIFIFLGLLAGLSIGAIRERIAFHIALLVVSLVSVFFAFSLARAGLARPSDLIIYSRYLFVFLIYAVVSFASELAIIKIWSRKFEFVPSKEGEIEEAVS